MSTIASFYRKPDLAQEKTLRQKLDAARDVLEKLEQESKDLQALAAQADQDSEQAKEEITTLRTAGSPTTLLGDIVKSCV